MYYSFGKIPVRSSEIKSWIQKLTAVDPLKTFIHHHRKCIIHPTTDQVVKRTYQAREPTSRLRPAPSTRPSVACHRTTEISALETILVAAWIEKQRWLFAPPHPAASRPSLSNSTVLAWWRAAVEMSESGVETDKNIEIWKIKKLIKALESARGNGTSMISLIMPPRFFFSLSLFSLLFFYH